MNVVFGSASVSLALPTIVGPAVAVVVLVASCDLIRNWRTLLVHLTPLPYLLLATYFCLFRSVLTRDLGNPLLKSDPILTHLFFDNWKTDLHLLLKQFFPKKVTTNFLVRRTESFVESYSLVICDMDAFLLQICIRIHFTSSCVFAINQALQSSAN